MSLEQFQIALDSANADLDKYKITAPFDGIILTSNYNLGEMSTTGTGTGTASGVSIISDTFVIKTDVNETDINTVKNGQQVLITFDPSEERLLINHLSPRILQVLLLLL